MMLRTLGTYKFTRVITLFTKCYTITIL